MNLRLIRQEFTTESTIGELYVDNDSVPICFTLEDAVREPGVKIPGKTAIPKGNYEISITFSNRFQQPMPLLLRVPLFDGIRIHSGNTSADTDGCILVGKETGVNSITRSREAYGEVFALIQSALQTEKVMIDIS